MPKTKEYSVDLRLLHHMRVLTAEKDHAYDVKVLNSLSKGRTQSVVAKEFGISQQLVSVWTRLCKKEVH